MAKVNVIENDVKIAITQHKGCVQGRESKSFFSGGKWQGAVRRRLRGRPVHEIRLFRQIAYTFPDIGRDSKKRERGVPELSLKSKL